MPKPLKFLFVPVDAVGCVNPYIGIGQELLLKGHSVFFAVTNSFKGKLAPHGFIEKFYQDESKGAESIEAWTDMIQKLAPVLKMPTIEKLEHFLPIVLKQCADVAKEGDAKLNEIIVEVQPDLIVFDHMHVPSASKSGIPWVVALTLNPMGITVENTPPAFSGYSIYGHKKQWDEFRKKEKEVLGPIFQDFSDWVAANGGPSLPYNGKSIWTNPSPYANLYMYPQELSYTINRPDPPNWFQFDTFSRFEADKFEIPTKLAAGPGKLVYFSLGTIGCAELGLMRRLIAIFAKSPNRFIVSKGVLGDQLQLADNMWGGNHLPQTNILPIVDLCITHGGNNTITEAFYFGTRVLVLPLALDQPDNGRRVEDVGLGLQFDPYSVSDKELLDGIERLLSDELLEKQMKFISTRIKSSRSQFHAAELLESVARNKVPI